MSRLQRGAITEAIEQASPGDQIRLQPGVYTETIVADRAVTIFADVPGETVIVPPGDACGLSITADVTVIGLSFDCQGRRNTAIEIAGGAPSLSSLHIQRAGTGILAKNNATPMVSHCLFSECSNGIQVSEGAQAELADCRVEDTALYPLLVGKRSSAQVLRTRFSGTRMGGVVVMEGSHAGFRGCEWLGSPTADEKQRPFHAQLMVLATGEATLSESCRIADGTAVGILISGGVLNMTDSFVERNAWAGIEVTQQGRAGLIRCQVSGNQGAGLIVRDGSTAQAGEVKVVRNTAAGVGILGPSYAEIKGSLILGNFCGAVLRDGARGRFEDCDMRGNAQGSFSVSPDSRQESVRVQTGGL